MAKKNKKRTSVRIQIEYENGNFYATSPDMKELIVCARNLEELGTRIKRAVDEIHILRESSDYEDV